MNTIEPTESDTVAQPRYLGPLLIIEKLEAHSALEREADAYAEADDAPEYIDGDQVMHESGKHAEDYYAAHGNESHGLVLDLAEYGSRNQRAGVMRETKSWK